MFRRRRIQRPLLLACCGSSCVRLQQLRSFRTDIGEAAKSGGKDAEAIATDPHNGATTTAPNSEVPATSSEGMMMVPTSSSSSSSSSLNTALTIEDIRERFPILADLSLSKDERNEVVRSIRAVQELGHFMERSPERVTPSMQNVHNALVDVLENDTADLVALEELRAAATVVARNAMLPNPVHPHELQPDYEKVARRQQLEILNFTKDEQALILAKERLNSYTPLPTPKPHPWVENQPLGPHVTHGDGQLNCVGDGAVGFGAENTKNAQSHWKGLTHRSNAGLTVPQINGIVNQNTVFKHSLKLTGKGLFATRPIKKGENVMVVASTTANVGYNSEYDRLIEMTVDVLRKAYYGGPEMRDLLYFWILAAQPNSRQESFPTDYVEEIIDKAGGQAVMDELQLTRLNIPKIVGVIDLNSYLVESYFNENRGQGYWPEAACFNHSCVPNCDYDILSPDAFPESDYFDPAVEQTLNMKGLSGEYEGEGIGGAPREGSGCSCGDPACVDPHHQQQARQQPQEDHQASNSSGQKTTASAGGGGTPAQRFNPDASPFPGMQHGSNYNAAAAATTTPPSSPLINSKAAAPVANNSATPFLLKHQVSDDQVPYSVAAKGEAEHLASSASSASSPEPSMMRVSDTARRATTRPMFADDEPELQQQQEQPSSTPPIQQQQTAVVHVGGGDVHDQNSHHTAQGDPLPFHEERKRQRYLFCAKANRDIAVGEELHISYVPPDWHFSQKEHILYQRYKFKCKCPKCQPQLEQWLNMEFRYAKWIFVVAYVLYLYAAQGRAELVMADTRNQEGDKLPYRHMMEE